MVVVTVVVVVVIVLVTLAELDSDDDDDDAERLSEEADGRLEDAALREDRTSTGELERRASPVLSVALSIVVSAARKQ